MNVAMRAERGSGAARAAASVIEDSGMKAFVLDSDVVVLN